MLSQTGNSEICEKFASLGFVTGTELLAPVLRQALKAAVVSDITVLLEGETGTGKQVLAYAIHQFDKKRKPFPFLTLHCGSISESLVESELFGHEKGAFSGAVNNRKGLFQAANHGTLFLDDINDLPLALQPRLLDVLQRGVIRAVGSDRETGVDVRIISASNKPLALLVKEHRFRADLYHRLNVVRIGIPPLRDRMGDIEAIVLVCARKHSRIYDRVESVEPELVRYLRGQPFPGNVRELEHGVERALFGKTEGSTLTLPDWMRSCEDDPLEVRNWVRDAADSLSQAIFQNGLSFVQAIHQVEGRLLEIALQSSRSRRETASRLQTSERTLYHRLRAHKITHRPPSEGSPIT